MYHHAAASLGALLVLTLAPPALQAQEVPATDARTSWTPDNGNGTFTNPLFNDEFSDPDIIRVGDDFYMTGTTMHVMPGLPVLHSKDLVNWRLLGYAFDRIEMGPEYRLEGGKETYGAGIWAPAIRFHNSTFYIFSNINRYGMQVFTATNPAGPWTRKSLDSGIHDLSVLFDDDGGIYAVYGYDEVHMIELKPDMSGFVEGSDRIIIPKGNAMGEGHHLYKVKGKYFIISANYAPVGRMQAARADTPFGPYETVTISARETMGTPPGRNVANVGIGDPVPRPGDKVELAPVGNANACGATPLHQGGIVDLPNGDWWGFSMMDVKPMGRTTFLSPVTWDEGWPYFGLPGNLGRSPRTWLKPATGVEMRPTPTFQRSDDFARNRLSPIWQWNHVPVDTKWSLTEKRGALRLHTLPATDFMMARNSLTQRAVAPESTATTVLDLRGLKPGDVAGLGLLNIPHQTLAVRREGAGYRLRFYDQLTDTAAEAPLSGPRVHLRVAANFDTSGARFSYSSDGKRYQPIGDEATLAYQLKTFQGVRYALFAYNTRAVEGGHADFESFVLDEPLADRTKNIPAGKVIRIRNLADDRLLWANPHGMLHFADTGSDRAGGKGVQFRVHDKGQGRVALEAMDGSGFVTVVGRGLSSDVRMMKAETPGSLFQWQDMLRGQFMLLSLKTNRYVSRDVRTGEPYGAESPGADPDRKDGSVLHWTSVE